MLHNLFTISLDSIRELLHDGSDTVPLISNDDGNNSSSNAMVIPIIKERIIRIMIMIMIVSSSQKEKMNKYSDLLALAVIEGQIPAISRQIIGILLS
jgi:hypothetical protein